METAHAGQVNMGPPPQAVDGSAQPGARHESYTVNIRPLVLFGAGLVLLAGISFWLTAWLFDAFVLQQAKFTAPPSPMFVPDQLPPEPRLQITPSQDLQAMLTAEQARLNSYAWINRKAGIVRIPIDRAMDLLAERDLPVGSETPKTGEE